MSKAKLPLSVIVSRMRRRLVSTIRNDVGEPKPTLWSTRVFPSREIPSPGLLLYVSVGVPQLPTRASERRSMPPFVCTASRPVLPWIPTAR